MEENEETYEPRIGLAEKRVKCGITQKKMAEMLGVKTITYFRFERGIIKTTSIEVFCKLKSILNMTSEEAWSLLVEYR